MIEAVRLLAFTGLLASVGSAEIVVIPSIADTGLFEWTDNFNFGSEEDASAGGLGGQAGDERLSRALFKFDIAGEVPAGAKVTAARMTLDVVVAPESFPRASEFALNRVLVEWGEGEKSGEKPGGAPATEGEATWVHRMAPATAWTSPGGAFGIDFASESAATNANVDGVGTYIFEFGPLGVAEVQSALDEPSGNHGWVLWSLDESLRKTARRWATRESSSDLAPQLEITWSLPPLAEVLSVEPSPDLEKIEVRFHGLAGIEYQAETLLPGGEWMAGDTLSPSSDGAFSFFLPIDGEAAFLRIRSEFLP